MKIDVALCNILLLSFAFFCAVTAFTTVFNIQKYVLEAVIREDPTFIGDSYKALCITFAFVALFTWIAPVLITAIGPRGTLLIGGAFNVVYIAQFLYPLGWMLYVSSVASGIAGALVWTAQGTFITLNSTEKTLERNSGILWAISQLGSVVGNLYIYLSVEDNNVDYYQRLWIFGFLTAMISLAGLTFLTLRKAVYTLKKKITPLRTFLRAMKLLISRDILLLSFTFFYVGIEMSFYAGVYGSSLGFTSKFEGMKDTTLISLSGLLTGIGEVVGGVLFGILGHKILRWGRYPAVLLGLIVHLGCYCAIFINSPNDSTNHPTDDDAIIKSSLELALICSFFLGFGDACYVTQIYGILGNHYPTESGAAFGLYRFVQNVAMAIAFFYTPAGMYVVLYLLMIFAILGAIGYIIVEFKPTYVPPAELQDDVET